MYVLLLTFSGLVTASIDNVQFKTKSDCQAYVKTMQYEDTSRLKFRCAVKPTTK